MSEQADEQHLLDIIENRRRSVEAFLRKAQPQAERLSLVSSTLR